MSGQESIDRQRIWYFDALRVLATLGVMILHVSGQNWNNTGVASFHWQVLNFFDGIVRWTVPMFAMISGALMLNANPGIEKIFKKKILRIATAFIFWSVLYAAVDLTRGAGIKGAFIQVIQGHYHMWFLYMIAGLYILIPLVKSIVESRSLTRYFLALGMLFTVIIPQGISLLQLIHGSSANLLYAVSGSINFHFTLGYVFYFVLGYYLNDTDISKKTRRIIYALSIFGFAVTSLGTSFLSLRADAPTDMLYGYFTANVMLESLGVFVFLKYSVGSTQFGGRAKTIVARLSKYSFGAYLVHAMVIELLNDIFGLNTLSFHPALSVAAITLILAVVSFAVSWICNHIPVLNQYIV